MRRPLKNRPVFGPAEARGGQHDAVYLGLDILNVAIRTIDIQQLSRRRCGIVYFLSLAEG